MGRTERKGVHLSMIICYIVSTILGVYCYQGAEPVGVCHDMIDGMICYVEAESLRARLSYYDPLRGGINCDQDCSVTADGTPVVQCWGWCMACPNGWEPKMINGRLREGLVIDFGDRIGEWHCRDRGGAIKPTWGEWWDGNQIVSELVIVVDLMSKVPPVGACRS